MAKFKDKCPECEKDFWNYDAAYRTRCSVACDIAARVAAEKWLLDSPPVAGTLAWSEEIKEENDESVKE